MSGSGGGGNEWRPAAKPTRKPGGQGRTGGTEAIPDPCDITEVTYLNSVDKTVISGLRPGDQLTVDFQPGPPQRLVAITSSEAIAGSITSPSMLQIIKCIQSGVSYVAEVLDIRGARCQISIHPG